MPAGVFVLEPAAAPATQPTPPLRRAGGGQCHPAASDRDLLTGAMNGQPVAQLLGYLHILLDGVFIVARRFASSVILASQRRQLCCGRLVTLRRGWAAVPLPRRPYGAVNIWAGRRFMATTLGGR